MALVDRLIAQARELKRRGRHDIAEAVLSRAARAYLDALLKGQ